MDDNLLKLVNASGFAFQMAVEHAVRSSHGHDFCVAAVEHPWRDPRWEREGFIDLVLESGAVTWVVECKRSRDADWVFLVDREKKEPTARTRCLWMTGTADGQRVAGWDDVSCKPTSTESQFCAVRGTGEGQQSLLERISGTLVRATDALADEDIGLMTQREGTTGAWGVYIPVIVTTAKLHVCDVDVSTISIEDGSVPDADLEEVVLSKNSADHHSESTNDRQNDLRCGSTVEAQHPAEPLGALDGARCRFGTVHRLDQPIIDPLMIPLPVVMSGVLASGLSQRSTAIHVTVAGLELPGFRFGRVFGQHGVCSNAMKLPAVIGSEIPSRGYKSQKWWRPSTCTGLCVFFHGAWSATIP